MPAMAWQIRVLILRKPKCYMSFRIFAWPICSSWLFLKILVDHGWSVIFMQISQQGSHKPCGLFFLCIFFEVFHYVLLLRCVLQLDFWIAWAPEVHQAGYSSTGVVDEIPKWYCIYHRVITKKMGEILHHLKDGWNPINSGMFTIYQLVQDFATIHSITWFCVFFGHQQHLQNEAFNETWFL